MADYFKEESLEEDSALLESEKKTALKTIGRNKSQGDDEISIQLAGPRNRVLQNVNENMPTNIENKIIAHRLKMLSLYFRRSQRLP